MIGTDLFRMAVAAGAACGVLGATITFAAVAAIPDDPRPTPTSTVTAWRTATRTATATVPGPTATRTVTAPPRAAQPATRATRSPQPAGFSAWLANPIGKAISWRESHNICSITNPTGKYQGKWQMDDAFWATYGGLAYAPNPHQATCHEQDLVAYRGWLARGWQPWGGAP